VSGRRKLSDAAIEFIAYSVSQRQELKRQLSMVPTNAVLADELGVSQRRIEQIVRKKIIGKVSVQASLNTNYPE
jgi:hypothetical protein